MKTPRMHAVLALALVAVAGCSKPKASASAPPPAPAGTLAAVRPAAEPVAEPDANEKAFLDFMRRLMAAPTLAQAVELTRPFMDDTVKDQSKGAIILTKWAMAHMKWSDVALKKNETSFAKVRKDSDEERGKRMCVSAGIVQISKVTKGVYEGLLLTNYGRDIYRFTSVGSTGDLVGNSIARFCGVVIGNYSYHNNGGGSSNAVALVGMFDLPENKGLPADKRKPASVDDEGSEEE